MTHSSSPQKIRQVLWLALYLAAGIAIGFFAHYLLYRLSLPTQPFIYVAF